MAYGFYGDAWADIPVFNFSGMLRAGPRGYLVSENYFITVDQEAGALLSLGRRSILRNIGLDYSLWIPVFPEMESFIAFPFLGITVPISQGRPKKTRPGSI